jgi:hypothetical protein
MHDDDADVLRIIAFQTMMPKLIGIVVHQGLDKKYSKRSDRLIQVISGECSLMRRRPPT